MIIRASPIKAIIKIWIAVAILIVLIHIAGAALNQDIGLLLSIDVFLVLLGIAASGIAWFIYRHHYLNLEEREVIYHTGVINLKAIRVPYHKIDNVRTERSLLNRILGLVDIYIDTPGENAIEIIAKDMPFTEFQIFYVELRKKMDEFKGSHGGYP